MSELTAAGPYTGVVDAELDIPIGKFSLTAESPKGDTLNVTGSRSNYSLNGKYDKIGRLFDTTATVTGGAVLEVLGVEIAGSLLINGNGLVVTLPIIGQRSYPTNDIQVEFAQDLENIGVGATNAAIVADAVSDIISEFSEIESDLVQVGPNLPFLSRDFQASFVDPNIKVIGSGTNATNNFEGTDGNDFYEGGQGADSVDGGDAGDLLRGQGAADVISGGPGNDEIYGGSGDDELYAGSEGATIFGGTGNDKLFAGSDGANLYGGSGNDILDARGTTNSNGGSYLYGGSDDDTLYGNGNSTLTGGSGVDTFHALKGDVIVDGEAQDILWYEGVQITPDPDAVDLYEGDYLWGVQVLGISAYQPIIFDGTPNADKQITDFEVAYVFELKELTDNYDFTVRGVPYTLHVFVNPTEDDFYVNDIGRKEFLMNRADLVIEDFRRGDFGIDYTQTSIESQWTCRGLMPLL